MYEREQKQKDFARQERVITFTNSGRQERKNQSDKRVQSAQTILQRERQVLVLVWDQIAVQVMMQV